MALAQTQLLGKVSNPRFARISSKDVESSSNCSMFFRRVPQTSDKGLFQNAEARGCVRCRIELFAQIPSRSFPKYFHIHMRIREFTCRNTQKAKCTARLEMHAHDVLPCVNEQRLRECP